MFKESDKNPQMDMFSSPAGDITRHLVEELSEK